MKELSAIACEAALAAARAAAGAAGVAIVVAVVDAGGELAAFLRMPGAYLVSRDLAIDKAWSAASLRQPTAALGTFLQTLDPAIREGLLRRPRLTDLPGGLVLTSGGVCIGGIGVSGGNGDEDEVIAAAAMAALHAALDEAQGG